MLPARSDVKGEMECQGNFCEAADLKLCMACYTSGTARSCSQTFLPFPCTTCDDDDSLKISLSENCGLFCCSPVAEHLSKQDDAFFEECEVSFELTPLEECFSSLSEVRKEHGFRRCHSLTPGRPRILNRADFILEQCTNIYKRDQHAGCSLFCWNCGHNLWSKSGLSMDCGIIEEVNDLKESYSKEECSLQHFDFKGFDNACKLRWGFQEEEVDFAKVAGLFHLYSPQHFPFLMTTVMPFCVAQESTSGGLPKVTAEGECQTEHCGDRGSDPIGVDVLHQSSCSFTPKHGRMCGENLAEKHADAEGICEENIQEENSSSNSTVGLKFVSGEISCADRVDLVGEHSQIAAAVGFSAFDYDDTIVEDSVLETVGSSPVPNHRLHCYPVLNVLSKNFLQESPNVSHKTEPAMALSHLPKDSLAMASDSESCSNKLPSRIEEDSIIYDIVTDNKDQTLDEGKGPAQALFQFSDSTPYFSVFSNDESRVSCYKQKLDTHFNSGIVLKNWLKPNLQKEEDPVHFFSSEEETELVPNLKFVVASAISSTPVMTCSSKEKVKSESEETSTNFDGHRSKGEKQICLSSVKQSTKESKIFAEREIHGEVKRNSATPTAWKVVMHQCSVMLHDVRQVIPSLGAHVDLTSLTCETQHKLGVEFKAKVLIDEGANSGCKKTGLMLLSPAAVPSCPGPKDVVLIRSLARVQRIKEVQNGLMKLRNTMENSEFPAVNESLLQKFPKRQIGCKFKPKETITGGKRLKYSKLQQFSCEKNTSPSQSTSHIGDGSDRRTEPEVKENASSPNRQRIHAETLRPADSSHHHEKSRKIKHSNEPSKTRRKKEKSGKTEKKKSASHKLSSGTAKRSGDTKSESSYTSQTDKNSCFGRLAPKPEFAVSETWTDSDSTERNMISCRTSNAEFSKKNWSLETWQDFLETKPCSNASPTKIKHHSLKYLYKKDKSAKEHPHGLQDEENNKSVLQDHSLTHRHVSKTPRMSPLSVQRESPVVKTHTKVRKSELAKGKSKKVCLSKSASSSVKSSVHIPNSSSLRSGQTSETRRKDRDGLEGQKSQSRKDKHSNEKESWKLEKHAQKDCQECSVFPKSLGAFKIPKKSDRVSLGASNPLHLWDIDSVNVVKTGERAKSELETRCQDSSSPSFNQVQVKQVSFEETYTSTLTQSGNAKYTKFQKTAEENVPNNSYNKHAKLPYRDEFYLEEPGQNLAQNVSCGKLSTPRVLITAPEISPKELQVSRGPKNQKQREREVIGDIAASMSCLYQLDKTGSGSSSSLSTSVGRKGEGTSSDSGSAEDLPEVGADGELPAQCQVAPPPSQDGTRNGHRSSAAAGDALPQPISPLRSKSAKQGQPVRGRGVEQIADDRKGRRAHPYSRPEHKVQREGKKYASFDLVYSLNELMTCMTSSTFKWSGRQCHLHGQRNQATYRRFANYRFKRSEVSAQDQEIEPEKLLTPDDIQDFEARKNLADMVETFPDPSTTGGFSNGEDTLSSMVTSNKDVPDIEDSRRIILTNDEDSVPSVSENLTLPSSSIETLKQSCTDVAVLSANTNLTQSSRSATDTLEGPLTDVAVSSSSSVFPMLHSVVSTPEDNNITTSNRLFEAEGPSLSTCHSSLDKPVSNNEVSTLTGDLGAESTDQECKDEVFTKEMLEKTEDGFLCQTMDEVGEPDTFDLNSCFDYNLPKATESEHSSSAEDRDAGERERDSLSGMHSGCNTVHEPFCQHSLALEFPVASKTSPSVASEQEDGQTVAGSSGDRNNTSSIDDIEKEDVSMESFDNAVICIHQVKEESTAFPQASNFCNSSEGEQILAGSCSVIKPVSDNIKDSEPQETQTTSSSVQDKECASLSEPTASPSLDLIYSLGNPHHNSLATEWSGSTFQSCDSEALVPKLSVRLSEESAGVGHAVDMQALLQKSPPPTQTHEMRAHAIGNMVQSFNQYSSRQTEGLPFQDCFLSSSPPPPPPPPLPPKLLPLSSRYSLPSLPSSPKVDKEEQQWLGTPLARPSAPDASNVLKTSKTKHMLSVMPQQDTDNLEQKFKVGGDQGISVVRKQSPVPYRYYVVHLRRLKKKIMYWEKKKVGRCLSKNEEKELDVLHAEYEKAKKHCKDYATSETEGSIKNMRTMKTGCHPLRHLKSIRTPERISFDHSPIKLKVDPELAKTDYSLVEVITGPARDPRLVPKCLREVMHRIKGWRRGQYNQPEASIKIVKVIPSVHSEGAVYTKKPALFPESNSREGIPCAKTVEKSIELDYPKKTLTELKNLCNSPSLDDPKGEHIATKLGQSPGIDTPGLWNHSHKITASAEAKGEKKMSYGQELLMHAQTTELMNESETKTCISENIFSKSSELFGDGKAFSVSQTAVLTEELLCEKPSSEQLEKSYQIVDQLNEERLCSDKEMSDQQKESRLFHFNDSNQNGPLHFQGSESAMAHKDSSERSLYFHKDHSSSVKEEVYGKQSEDPVNVTTTFGAEAKDTRSQSRLPSFEHEWSRELYNNVLWSDNSTNDSFGETKAQRVDEVLPVSNASPKELRSDTGATSEDADKTLAQGLALELEKKPHFEFSDVKEVFTKVDSSRMNSGEKASQFPVGGHTSLMHGKRKCPGTPTEEYLLVSTAKRVSPKFILKDSLVSSSSANVLLDRVSSDSGLKWMHSYPKDKDFQTSSNRKRNDSIEELPLLKLDPTSSKVLPEKTRSHSRFTSSPEYVESPCNSGVKKDTKHRIVFRDTEKNRAPSESLLWNENSPLSRNIIVISDESSCERADPRKISKLKKRSRFSPLKDPAEGSKKPPIMSLSQFEDLPKQSFSHLSKDSKSIGTRRFQDYEVDEFPAAVMAREKGLQSRSSAASSSYSGVIKPSAACSSDREEVRPSAEPWHPRDDGKQSSTYYRSRRESPAGRATSAKSPESTKAKNRTRAASEDKEPSLSAARDGQRASLSGSTDHTTSSGVIVPATAALTNFKMLSKLLQQLGDLNKKGHKWFMDIHISTICEIEDMRGQLPQYSPHVVETEKCLALLRSSQLSGLVKFIHLCPCRIQPGCALQQMAGCLRQRRGPEVRGIILTAPKEEGENSNDDWGDNDLGTVSVDKVVKFLSSFI
ncbi:uncharacterized protein LOC118477859 isoform X1 [Aplysia californica]|uniref:Uncharacterized protein LOC118477859 isoform X1 n=1 Tax=Aplysia californica TaxID=6500 RepID=A0ABM1VV27_APLCA|nr:uncharacterized protein LOC118477859 isoform X1 [Aplysia californica]